MTGYVVHYYNHNTEESFNVSASINFINIGNLTNDTTYTVWVEATCDCLSGLSDVKTLTLSEDVNVILIVSFT